MNLKAIEILEDAAQRAENRGERDVTVRVGTLRVALGIVRKLTPPDSSRLTTKVRDADWHLEPEDMADSRPAHAPSVPIGSNGSNGSNAPSEPKSSGATACATCSGPGVDLMPAFICGSCGRHCGVARGGGG